MYLDQLLKEKGRKKEESSDIHQSQFDQVLPNVNNIIILITKTYVLPCKSKYAHLKNDSPKRAFIELIIGNSCFTSSWEAGMVSSTVTFINI